MRHNLLGKHAPQAPGPRPGTWWKLGKRPLYTVLASPVTVIDGKKVTPLVFTRPEAQVQKPVNSNSKDRKGWRRAVTGGIVRG